MANVYSADRAYGPTWGQLEAVFVFKGDTELRSREHAIAYLLEAEFTLEEANAYLDLLLKKYYAVYSGKESY